MNEKSFKHVNEVCTNQRHGKPIFRFCYLKRVISSTYGENGLVLRFPHKRAEKPSLQCSVIGLPFSSHFVECVMTFSIYYQPPTASVKGTEGVGSNHGRTNTQGLKITKEKVPPLQLHLHFIRLKFSRIRTISLRSRFKTLA